MKRVCKVVIHEATTIVCTNNTAGDEKRLAPTVLSNQGGKRYNEVSNQLEVPFVSRLLGVNYPSITLTQQLRYRQCFISWLNERTYAGRV
jgi:hypothetical protein